MTTLARRLLQMVRRVLPVTVGLPTAEGFVPRRDHLALVGAARFSIGRRIVADGIGGYEPEVMATLCALIEDAPARARFLDIGANIGIFALASKALFGERLDVIAFEPAPEPAGFLRATAARNQLAIEIRPIALSSGVGKASFYLSSKSDLSSSLNRTFRRNQHRGVIEVDRSTVDALWPDDDDRTYVLKIDTESTEPDVLDGAERLIERKRPAIICEVLAGRTEERLRAIVARHGYHACHIRDRLVPRAVSEIAGDPTYAYRDWLFTPAEVSPGVHDGFARWYAALTPQRARPS